MPDTPLLGLTYPDNTDHTRLWEHFQTLAESVEAALEDAYSAWTDYTPVWSKASGTAPSLGNGTLQGRYLKVGKKVLWQVRFVWGSTTNPNGTEIWHFSLPVQVGAQPFSEIVAGHLTIQDANGNWYMGAATVAAGGTNTVRMRFHGGGANNTLASTTPFTWATSDHFMLDGFYESV